ncbi:hypothetical protein [Bdellovibrio bacteriovorus]
MKISIITDGNNNLGMGHVYQSVTLANLLKNYQTRKIEITFNKK